MRALDASGGDGPPSPGAGQRTGRTRAAPLGKQATACDPTYPVQRAMGTPARSPPPRGTSPGRAKGTKCGKARRFSVVTKTPTLPELLPISPFGSLNHGCGVPSQHSSRRSGRGRESTREQIPESRMPPCPVIKGFDGIEGNTPSTAAQKYPITHVRPSSWLRTPSIRFT